MEARELKEQELFGTLTSLCQQHGLNVLINPPDYEIQSPAAIDVEHDEEGNLVGIGVYDSYRSLYFTSVSDMLRDLLLQVDLIGHNAKGDFDSLRQWGIPVLDDNLIWDTELISHIIDSSRKGYGLKKLAKEDLGIEYPSYDDLVGKKAAKIRRTLDKWPVEIVSKYNACDTWATYHLYLKQKQINETYS